jgi:predicted nuclease of predicted toxin-antitoxin system
MGKIRIYTDESTSVSIAEGLKRRGVDTFSARDAGNLGLTDEEQLIYARQETATIFTHDTDFLQIAARWLAEGRTHRGIIYCHQKRYSVGKCVRK